MTHILVLECLTIKTTTCIQSSSTCLFAHKSGGQVGMSSGQVMLEVHVAEQNSDSHHWLLQKIQWPTGFAGWGSFSVTKWAFETDVKHAAVKIKRFNLGQRRYLDWWLFHISTGFHHHVCEHNHSALPRLHEQWPDRPYCIPHPYTPPPLPHDRVHTPDYWPVCEFKLRPAYLNC